MAAPTYDRGVATTLKLTDDLVKFIKRYNLDDILASRFGTDPNGLALVAALKALIAVWELLTSVDETIQEYSWLEDSGGTP